MLYQASNHGITFPQTASTMDRKFSAIQIGLFSMKVIFIRLDSAAKWSGSFTSLFTRALSAAF